MSAAPPGDPLGRWNAASPAALRGVEAHAYRQADEAYAEAAARLPEGGAHARLTELRRLFALRWIDRNSGSLLAAGRLTADQTASLPDALEEAVAVVAEHTPSLVETFALPERLMSDWPIMASPVHGRLRRPRRPLAPGPPDRAPGPRRGVPAARLRKQEATAAGEGGGARYQGSSAGVLGDRVRARPVVREAAGGRRRIGSPEGVTGISSSSCFGRWATAFPHPRSTLAHPRGTPKRGNAMTTIHPKITEVLTGTFKVPAAEILPESTMDSLEMDSLAVAEFAVIIKETLGVSADSEKLYKDATLADITAYIDEAVDSAESEATVPVSNTR